MEVRVYVVGASSNPDKITCKVPFRIDDRSIFFGPCKKGLRKEFRERFLRKGVDRTEIQEQIVVVGVNAANAEQVRKIVWVGQVETVLTFERAFKDFRGKRFEKMRNLVDSPLHVEPIYQQGLFAGYRLMGEEHRDGDAWVEDFIGRHDNGYILRKGDHSLLLSVHDGFPRDCCFICQNLFFARGEGMAISDAMVKTLADVQRDNKTMVGPYALFGVDSRGRAIGLRGSDLQIFGSLAVQLLQEITESSKHL